MAGSAYPFQPTPDSLDQADMLVTQVNDADDPTRWIHVRPRSVVFPTAPHAAPGQVHAEIGDDLDVHVALHSGPDGWLVDIALSDENDTPVQVRLDGDRLR